MKLRTFFASILALIFGGIFIRGSGKKTVPSFHPGELDELILDLDQRNILQIAHYKSESWVTYWTGKTRTISPELCEALVRKAGLLEKDSRFNFGQWRQLPHVAEIWT